MNWAQPESDPHVQNNNTMSHAARCRTGVNMEVAATSVQRCVWMLSRSLEQNCERHSWINFDLIVQTVVAFQKFGLLSDLDHMKVAQIRPGKDQIPCDTGCSQNDDVHICAKNIRFGSLWPTVWTRPRSGLSDLLINYAVPVARGGFAHMKMLQIVTWNFSHLTSQPAHFPPF